MPAISARCSLAFLLLVLLNRPGLSSGTPCGANWTYDSGIGWCFRQFPLALSWPDARAHCAHQRGPEFGSRAAGARFGGPSNQSAASAASALMVRLANFGDMWVAARKGNQSSYQWVDEDPPANVTTGWSSNPGTEDCVYMTISPIASAADWTSVVQLSTASCTDLKQFYCSFKAKSCSLTGLIGYSADSMDLRPQAVNIGEATTVNCGRGYYRLSQADAAALREVTSAAATSGKAANSVNCTDTAGSSDPELVTPEWVQGAIEPCIKVGCRTDILLELGIANSLPFSNAIVQSVYEFDRGFNVTCKQGYVSSVNSSSKVAQVSCRQDPYMPWQGIWLPSSSDVCSPIKCTDVRTFLANYTGVRPFKAYNQEANLWFSDLEVNKFSSYSSEVYVTCSDVGLFFQDQKYERQLVCLVENDTSITASWAGIRGTFITDNVIQNVRCVEVVCNLVDLFHLMEEGGSVFTLLVSYYINDGIAVYDAKTNVLNNLTRFQVSSIGSLLYGSYISVSCQSDRLFVQSGTDQANLVLSLMQITILCTKTGQWNQTIGLCIERTAAIQLLGSQKQYVPPAKEANAALQMGIVTICIVILFFACIVILDLATIKRDFNLLNTNIFYLRIRLKQL